MEASSTTLNIASSAPEPEQAPKSTASRHNHGPNFGRYVTGCEGCIAKYPLGPPPRGAVKSAKAAAAGREATKKYEAVASSANAAVDGLLNEIERLKQKLAQAQNFPLTVPSDIQLPKSRTEEDPMAELVGIMLRKEAAQARKEQTQEERNATSREQMLAIEMQAIAMKEANQAACEKTGHVKENGRTAINGQIHNDGYYHPFCIRCFKTFKKVLPRGEFIQNSVQ